MPVPYLKKLAEEGHGTITELERKWDDAKAQAAKSGQAENFAYVTTIFQRLAKINEASIDFSAQTAGLADEMTPGHPVTLGAGQLLKAYSPQGPITPVQTGINMGQMTTADNNYLDSLVESGQFTRAEVDRAWAAAKKKADANAKANPKIVPSYAYTTAIFQSELGIKAEASVKIKAAQRLVASKVR